MKKMCFFIILFIFHYLIFAEENNITQKKSSDFTLKNNETQSSQTNDNDKVKLITQNNELFIENEKLNKSLETTIQSFDRVTNAYWWSLSIIIGIIVFILGGNFIFQRIDRSKLIESISDELDKKYSKINEESIAKIKEEYLQSILQIKNELESNYNLKIKFIKNDISSALDKIKELNLKLLENKFKEEKNTSKTLSMSTAVSILLLLTELYGDRTDTLFDHYFIEYLVYITTTLKEGNQLLSIDAGDVNELLDKLPEKFSKYKNDITSLVEYRSMDID